MIEELKKSNYECKQFLNTYFQTLLKEKDEKEILSNVQKLKLEIEEEKKETKKKIQNEIEKYNKNIEEMKEHTASMKEQLIYRQGIYKQEETTEEMKKKINQKNESESSSNINNQYDETQPKSKNIHEESFSESEEENTNIDKLEESQSFEDLLKKSVETKMKLEHIRKGFLFLKQFPILKKETDELYITTKNMKLEVEEKMKNVLTLYNNLLYINENEEMISHLKEYANINIVLYTQSYFNDFFNLLHEVIHSYLFDGSNVSIYKLLKVYIVLYKTYLKYKNETTGTNESIASEIINRIIQLSTTYFRKTFVKFVQSENDSILYNCIIQYYEFFSTFIGDNEENLERILFTIFYICDHEDMVKELSDLDVMDNYFEIYRNVEKESNRSNEEEGTESENTTIEKSRYASLINEQMILLFTESIYIVCDFLANNKIVKSLDINNKTEETGKTNQTTNNKNRNFIIKIVDALKVSIGILSNCTVFISRKKLLEPILKQAVFINKKIVEEYLMLITKGVSFNNEELENMNMKLSNVERNSLTKENKLLDFFTEIRSDMKNTIQKKHKEVHNNEGFNTHFFRFVIYFYFISTHDTEFLFLFINLYNFLYEITYNIKEEIKKIKSEIDKEQMNKTKFNESLQLKDEVAISSNKIIEYIKNSMQTFIKLLSIFNELIKDYEQFCSFIVEQTYNSLKNENHYNTISKQILRKEKYPTELEPHILYIHNYFFNEDARDITKNSTTKEERIKEKENTSNSLKIQPINKETNKQIFKSSLSKVYEIQNYIVNNIVYFALIPLFEYLNKYTNRINALQEMDSHNLKDPSDPEQNICLMVHVLFTYIEIFYEHKNEMIIQQLFGHLIEKYTQQIKNLPIVNKYMILQIHVDVQYLINVCKKFKIINYKPCLLLYYAMNYQLLKRKENNTQPNIAEDDTDVQIKKYFKEHEPEFNELSFNITNEDIASVTSFIKQTMNSLNK